MDVKKRGGGAQGAGRAFPARLTGEISAAILRGSTDNELMFSVGQKVVLVDDKMAGVGPSNSICNCRC